MSVKLSKSDKYRKYRNTACYTLSNMYDSYPNKHLITRSEFMKTLTTFNDILIQSSIDTGRVYELPHGAGVIGARKFFTTKTKSVDFRASRDAGRYIAHKNFHSGGFIGKIIWDKDKRWYLRADRDMINVVAFEPTRPHKRMMARAIIDKNSINHYYDI